ncbi:MAG: transketolase [Treponema sp.]|jgi:transketolase|nr:transketolase [Treponema sp.]
MADLTQEEKERLKRLSAQIRINVLKMLKYCTYGHLGGSLSIVEVLSVLYGKYMRYDPQRPDWEDRDYLVLSKGHSGPGLYAALSAVGFFDEQTLYTLNQNGTSLPSHPDRTKTPGIDATTGSLGQGTSVAAGLAYGMRLHNSDRRVYLIVGDGELNEGQCWEAFQFIAANRLHNLIVFIDENKRQLDGLTKDVLNPFSIIEKMRAFGFSAVQVPGNDEAAIALAIESAYQIQDHASCIILDTIKGQGIPYFEEMIDNHSVKFNEADYKALDQALVQLEKIATGAV